MPTKTTAKKSEPMTLDEAVAHAEGKAGTDVCGKNHAQLAEWLKELKSLRETVQTLRNQVRTERQNVEAMQRRQARQRDLEADSLPYADERR